ncbi:ArdC-like ssDNA-binding domain-containing protein, partial [Rhizobium redzepovicii]
FAVLHFVAALRVQAALAARLSDRRSRSRWPRPRNGGSNMSSQAISRGFASSRWMTFRQAIELGGAVRKGETGTTVVFASSFIRT